MIIKNFKIFESLNDSNLFEYNNEGGSIEGIIHNDINKVENRFINRINLLFSMIITAYA